MSPGEGHGADDDEKRFKEEFINSIINEFSSVAEDDEMGKLANKLGAANLTGMAQLTDISIGPFINEHHSAVVTFYQKCECAIV